MSAASHDVFYSFEEYVAFENSSNVKHEYVAGRIYAMAGGTPEHAALQAATIGLLIAALRSRPCRAYTSDLRVRVQATGMTTYPDATVVCGPPQMDAKDPLSLVNPILLVEVLSPSSATYDRGEKFTQYKRIPSLQEYVLVSQEERRIEVYTRGVDDEWSVSAALAGGSAELSSIGGAIDVNELYETAGIGA